MSKETPDCVSIKCVYNDQLHKGLCVGVSHKTRSYAKDVIRMCWVAKKPKLGTKCDINMQVQMTPNEAESIGVGLIRSSGYGEDLLTITRVKSNGEVKKKDETGKNH